MFYECLLRTRIKASRLLYHIFIVASSLIREIRMTGVDLKQFSVFFYGFCFWSANMDGLSQNEIFFNGKTLNRREQCPHARVYKQQLLLPRSSNFYFCHFLPLSDSESIISSFSPLFLTRESTFEFEENLLMMLLWHKERRWKAKNKQKRKERIKNYGANKVFFAISHVWLYLGDLAHYAIVSICQVCEFFTILEEWCFDTFKSKV